MGKNRVPRFGEDGHPLCGAPECKNAVRYPNLLCDGHRIDHTAAAEQILIEVAREFEPEPSLGLPPSTVSVVAQLKGPSRTRPLAKARQIAVNRIRQHTSLSWHEIGRLFGRTHCWAVDAWHCGRGDVQVQLSACEITLLTDLLRAQMARRASGSPPVPGDGFSEMQALYWRLTDLTKP